VSFRQTCRLPFFRFFRVPYFDGSQNHGSGRIPAPFKTVLATRRRVPGERLTWDGREIGRERERPCAAVFLDTGVIPELRADADFYYSPLDLHSFISPVIHTGECVMGLLEVTSVKPSLFAGDSFPGAEPQSLGQWRRGRESKSSYFQVILDDHLTSTRQYRLREGTGLAHL
jgi:hypothetical protein